MITIEYPAVGFGTYPLQEEVCAKAVETAAQVGYRIIDTATFYENFVPIGQVLKRLGRENFFLISKVWRDHQSRDDLLQDISMTLEQLDTEYLDAYLLHWPNSQIPIEETLSTMAELQKAGLVRQIGLSNVTIHHVKRALETGVAISWVQVEMNPFFYDADLIQFCHKEGIGIQAWGPLSRGKISHDPLLAQIGKKYDKTASQIALRWIVQHGCIPLPGSQNPQHIQQNFSIMDFQLSEEEMEQINARAKNGQRERVTKEMIGWEDEFDFTYEQCWPKNWSLN